MGLSTNAQVIKVSGLVIDKSSGQPLPNASVYIKGVTNTDYNNTTVTNRKGVYNCVFPEKGFYSLRISYLGYKSFTVDSLEVVTGLKEMQSIVMTIEQSDLGEVSVKAKAPLILVTADKIILNVAQSILASGNNGYDLLKRIPGVLDQNDKLSFRGQMPMILINGRPTHLTGDDLKNMLSELQSSNIESIEVLPNSSVKYDASANVIINIILVKNKNFGTNYNLSNTVNVGRFIRNTATLDFNNRNKKVNLFGLISYASGKQFYEIETQRTLNIGDIRMSEYNVRARNNIGYKIGLDVDLNKRSVLGFVLNGYINNRDRIASNVSKLHLPTNIFDSSSIVLTNTMSRIASPTMNLFYKISDTLGREFSLNMDFMDYKKVWGDYFTNRYVDEMGKSYLPDTYLRNNSPARLSVFVITADYTKVVKSGKWDLGIKSSFTWSDNNIQWEGFDNLNWVNDVTKTNHFLYRENIFSAYASYAGRYKKLTYQTGIRAEQSLTSGYSLTNSIKNSNNFLNLFPSVTITYAGKNSHPLSFNYRKTILRFGFDYVNPFIFYQNIYSYVQGNPKLKPQINHRFSFNYSLFQGILVGGEYTRSVQALGVSYKADNLNTISSYDNFQSSDIFYAYINSNKSFSPWWSVNINFAAGYFSVNANTSNTISTVRQKPFYTFQFLNSLQLKNNYSTEISFSSSSALITGIFQRKGYFSVDAGIGKNFANNKWNVKIAATDIFNSLITEAKVDYQNVKMDNKTKIESRFLNITLKYRFGNSNVTKKAERQSKVDDLKNRLNQ
jgi:hypothetical protein